MKKKETFECPWCKAGGLSRKEYTYPIEEAGGWDAETEKEICEGCADAATEVPEH